MSICAILYIKENFRGELNYIFAYPILYRLMKKKRFKNLKKNIIFPIFSLFENILILCYFNFLTLTNIVECVEMQNNDCVSYTLNI